MLMKKYSKIKLGHKQLGTYPVYSDKICKGEEPLKIVGMRENETEVEHAFFIETHKVTTLHWVKDEDLFLVKEMCDEELKPNGCQVHNVHCCGGGHVVSRHVDKYWENLIN